MSRLAQYGKNSKSRQQRKLPTTSASKQPGTHYTLRPGQAKDDWELVPPREAVDRAEDLEEVRSIIDAGEYEVAQDELRWLLDGYHDLLDAHRMLGELALEARDLKLGRAHFGYAFKLGLDALPTNNFSGSVPYSLTANQSFLESGKGLAWCLQELGKVEQARDVWQQLLRLDPTDPLGASAILAKLAANETKESQPSPAPSPLKSEGPPATAPSPLVGDGRGEGE